MLLLVALDTTGTPARAVSDPVWIASGEALTAAIGEAAVVGWFETATVLGAILPAVRGDEPETLVRRELSRRLEPAALGGLSIQAHIYSATSGGVESSAAAGPFVDQRRSAATDRRPARHRIKRCLDAAGSLILIVAFSPLILVISVLLKLMSPGPVLFRQKRIGEMGKPFTMFKFRTMTVNADQGLHHEHVTTLITSRAQSQSAGRAIFFKLANDPRVTPFGRILRRTSLDELPQLWNVLRGQMSLVGPRPPLDYEVAHYQPWHWRRVLEAKPGMTGLWQVAGRSRTTFDQMVRLDLRYVRTCSLWTDIRILLDTPLAVISGKGAG